MVSAGYGYRILKELICIVCPKGCRLTVDEENAYKVTGQQCPRGIEYGREELQNPVRVLTSTVVLEGGAHSRLPVRTDRPIPKSELFGCIKALEKLRVHAPVQMGQVLAENFCGTGADLIASRSMERVVSC